MIDSHCHLADETFAADLEQVIARAKDGGRRARAGHPRSGQRDRKRRRPRRVERLWPEVRFSIGVHPHQAHQFAGDPERAATTVREQLAATPSARAVGEIGLDYHYDFSPRDVQQAVFRAQVRLARELDRPVVIHTREADEDTIAILRDEGGGEVRGVLHCFTGNAALADAGLALGLFVSLAGILTFPKAGRAARDGPARAARSAADRNRQPVSGAGAVSRQAERAGLRRAGRGDAGGRCTSMPADDLAAAHRRRISIPCSGRDKVLNETPWKNRRSPCRRSSSRSAPTSRRSTRSSRATCSRRWS